MNVNPTKVPEVPVTVLDIQGKEEVDAVWRCYSPSARAKVDAILFLGKYIFTAQRMPGDEVNLGVEEQTTFQLVSFVRCKDGPQIGASMLKLVEAAYAELEDEIEGGVEVANS